MTRPSTNLAPVDAAADAADDAAVVTTTWGQPLVPLAAVSVGDAEIIEVRAADDGRRGVRRPREGEGRGDDPSEGRAAQLLEASAEAGVHGGGHAHEGHEAARERVGHARDVGDEHGEARGGADLDGEVERVGEGCHGSGARAIARRSRRAQCYP